MVDTLRCHSDPPSGMKDLDPRCQECCQYNAFGCHPSSETASAKDSLLIHGCVPFLGQPKSNHWCAEYKSPGTKSANSKGPSQLQKFPQNPLELCVTSITAHFLPRPIPVSLPSFPQLLILRVPSNKINAH